MGKSTQKKRATGSPRTDGDGVSDGTPKRTRLEVEEDVPVPAGASGAPSSPVPAVLPEEDVAPASPSMTGPVVEEARPDEEETPAPSGNNVLPAEETTSSPPLPDEDAYLLVVGDTHFTSQQCEDTNIMARRTLEVVQKLGSFLDGVVLLGDLVDRFSLLALTDAQNWVIELARLKPVWLVIGNHDLQNHNLFLTKRHPFCALAHIANVTVMDVPTPFTVKGMQFLGVPYVPDGRLDEALRSTDPDLAYVDSCHAVFSHQMIYNSFFNGRHCVEGDKWPLSRPFLANGHIHGAHDIQDNARNMGSPYQIHHGEPEECHIYLLRASPRPIQGASPPQAQLKLERFAPGPLATHRFARCVEHQRLSLRVPVKRTVRLTFTQFQAYEYVDDPKVYQLRLVLSGSKAEFENLKAEKKLRSMARLAPKVVLKFDMLSAKRDAAVVAQGPANYLQTVRTTAPAELRAPITEIFGS